jgi:hypothetical protein
MQTYRVKIVRASLSPRPAGSPRLNGARVHEPEQYNTSANAEGQAVSHAAGVVNTVLNIHNPSMEVHLAAGPPTGAAVICIAGGGHNILNLAGGGLNFVPFFDNFGISTVVLRPRLRIDGGPPENPSTFVHVRALFHSEYFGKGLV